jgi:hypothetical protein
MAVKLVTIVGGLAGGLVLRSYDRPEGGSLDSAVLSLAVPIMIDNTEYAE